MGNLDTNNAEWKVEGHKRGGIAGFWTLVQKDTQRRLNMGTRKGGPEGREQRWFILIRARILGQKGEN